MSEPTGPHAPQDLAGLLAAAVRDLRAGRFMEAAGQLGEVVADPDLAAAEDLRDVRARAFSLLAQALLGAGRPAEAQEHVRAALRLLSGLQDEAGLAQVRALQGQIFGALAEQAARDRARRERAALAATPVEEVLAPLADDLARAARLIEKATADEEAGAPEAAAAHLARALALADALGAVREQVLARLGLARHRPAERVDLVREAHRIAEAAAEFNLVGAITLEAGALGVPLPVIHGPSGLGDP